MTRNRRGVYAPLAAATLLVAMSGLALIIDRVWLENARLELQTGAEAGALAAAKTLATDDLLRPPVDWPVIVERATAAAVEMAGENVAVGQPIEVRSGEDVHFGKLVLDSETGLTRFLETPYEPTSVVVFTERTRLRNNPVGLFVSGLTGLGAADVRIQAEATLDASVIGVRPWANAPAPLFPLAILRQDATGANRETWLTAIERKQGPDEWGVDLSGDVIETADGISELKLQFFPASVPAASRNAYVLDLGSNWAADPLTRQWQRGVLAPDLADWGGELNFGVGSQSSPLTISGLSDLKSGDRDALDMVIGQQRIALLYEMAAPAGQREPVDVQVVGLVALRVMTIQDLSNGGCEVVVQPTVMATRTALVASKPGEPVAVPHPYLRRLTLTH